MDFGKIFSYDSTKGVGIAVLENGEQVEFGISNWKNVDVLPEVGQMISWIEDKMSVISDADKEALLFEQSQNDLAERLKGDSELANKVLVIKEEFNKAEKYVIPFLKEYYENKGFRTALIKETDTNYFLSMEKYTSNSMEKVSYKNNQLNYTNEDSSVDSIALESIMNDIIHNLDTKISTGTPPKNIPIEKTKVTPSNTPNETSSQETQNEVDGMGIASLVIGIAGFFFLGFLLGPLALVLGGMAPKPRSGFAIAGMVIGGLLTVITVGALILGFGILAII